MRVHPLKHESLPETRILPARALAARPQEQGWRRNPRRGAGEDRGDPRNYLVQLLNELREGGLVDSKRGKTGGYRLAKAPEDITLKQVLAVVEPDLIDTKITLKGASGPQVAALWREVSKRFDKSLTGFTVAQLALTESGTDFEI